MFLGIQRNVDSTKECSKKNLDQIKRKVHRGQSRRFSSSPEARYVGGERVPSRVPPCGGERGEWTVVRPRRRKVFEQADGQRDRFLAVQRRGEGWGDHQRQWSRSRVHTGSDWGFGNEERLPSQTFDRKAALQYSKSGSKWGRQQRRRAEPEGYSTVAVSRDQQIQRRRPWTDAGRGRARYREAAPHQLFTRKAREARVRTAVGRGRARDSVASHRRFPRKEGEEAAGHGRWLQHEHWHRDPIELDDTGTGKQPFVSFYFTNVPEDISYIALRQGFEVCGILEDVYLAKKRNVNGVRLCPFW